jgi:WD repeat-containing protein 22
MRYAYRVLSFKLDLSDHLGHLSIVNTTLIHPVLPVIATAGIERHVILHSPTPNAPWATDLLPTPTTTRPLPSGGPTPSDPSVLRLLMRLSTIMEVDESMGEDARSIAYFDLCVSPLSSSPPFVC